ncbi:MAG: DUF4340 domain-containing protein [Clostridiaceae bacterium]|nr:DUF4340 domain-containing protein [Clostridiaceae bacterium]
MKLPKKFKPLIFALGALILVGAAYLLIVNLTPEPVEDEQTNNTQYYQMTDYELKNLDHITFTFDDGYTYTIKLTHKSETSRTYSIEGKAQYSFDTSSLSTACLSMASISTSKFIGEDMQDLTAYGLDKPAVVVEFEGTDGAKTKLTLGSTSAVGTYTYAMKDDSTDVYMLSSYVTKYLLARDTFYRKLTLLTLDSEAPVNDVAGLTITNRDEEMFSYKYLSDEEMEQNPDLSVRLLMTYPFENQLNEATLSTYLLNYLVDVTADSVVEDAPKDLAKYNLTSDLTVFEWTLMDGTTGKLTLSQPTEDGIRYGYASGIDSVLSFDAEDFAFIDTFNYKMTLYRLLWTYSIKDLSGFDVNAHGETYEVRLFDPTTEEADAGQTFWATFDGEELREENARRLYVRVLSPSVYDLTDESMEVSGEPEWSAVIHFDTGRADETIAFYQINSRQYAAYRNGEPTGFYVNLIDLQAIDTAIQTIQAGDLIPS